MGLALATAAVLAACGGGSSEPAAAADTAPAALAALRQPTTRAAAAAATAATAAATDQAAAAAQLLDFAEASLPQHFPTREATLTAAPFVYRHYPDTGTYVGVALGDAAPYVANGVYVLGGPFGAEPTFVGQVTDFITPAPYTVSVASDKLLVPQGGSASVRVTVQRHAGFTGALQLTLSGLPAGVSAAQASIAADAASTDIVLSAQAGAPHSLPTTAALKVAAAGQSLLRPLSVTVRGAAGAVDTSFGGGAQVTPVGFEDYANAVAVQADGKVLVAGSSSSSAGTFVTVVRYGRDGGLDASFGNAGKVVTPVGPNNDTASAIAVQPDGRILVAGSTAQASGGTDFLLLRYRADGSLDTSFGQGGKVVTPFGGEAEAYALAVQADGRIVVAGETQSGAATTGVDFALARYLPDGSLDAGFGTGGKVVTAISTFSGRDTAYALALPVVDGEQRILAVGGEGNFIAARYRANGALDAGFGTGGKVSDLFNANIGAARAVTLLPDGRAVLAGAVLNDFAAVRLTIGGALDTSFGNGGRVVHAVSAGNWDAATAVVRQADGKLVLGGWVYAGNSSSGDFAALRLHADGSVDTGFGSQGLVVHPVAAATKSDIAHALVLQADPRVSTVRAIQAGEASGSNYDFALIRLWL